MIRSIMQRISTSCSRNEFFILHSPEISLSKKSHNAINVISGISVCGVALATLALVCTLSVFNGFQSLVSDYFTAFDPELKITPVTGKVFDGTGSEDSGIAQHARD